MFKQKKLMSKIVIYGNNFSPESIGIPRYTTEMTNYLSNFFNENHISVICAHPAYPDWKKNKDYNYFSFSKERKGNISIIRVPTYVPQKYSFIKRILYEFIYFIFSLPIVIYLSFFNKKVDLIITSPPFFLGLVFKLIPKKINKILIIKDLQIDIAEGMKIIKNRNLLKFLYRVEKIIFDSADSIHTVSQNMKDRIKSKSINQNIFFFPDWVDVGRLDAASIENINKFKKINNIDFDKFVIGYSGNIAKKQGLEFFLDIIQKINLNYHKFVFVICGDGVEKVNLIEKANLMKLKNIIFLPLQPEENLSTLLSSIDIHFVPQKFEVNDLVMPGKIFNIMSCKKPVITISPDTSSIAKMIKLSNSGINVSSFKEELVIDAFYKLYNDPNLQKKMGSSGREFIIKNYEKNNVIKNFINNYQKSKIYNEYN